MRAMIVAAGLGTRLQPLTDLLPKPALPVRGVPLIAYQLALLRDHGVREVAINVHHLAEALEAAAERWCPPGLVLHFSRERELLGTGGGIVRMADFLRESDPSLVIGGDMVLDFDLGALTDWHRAGRHAASLLLREDPRAARFGTIGVDREGRVRRVAGRFDLGGECRAGVYAWANVLSPRIFDSAPSRGAFSHLDDWWMPELARGADDIRGFVASEDACLWEPVGTPAEYLSANLSLPPLSFLDLEEASARAGARILRDAAGATSVVLGAGARVAEDAELTRAVVWDGERVPAGFRASGGVFAGGVWHDCDGGEAAAAARAGSARA
jgi:NDP-sugar pyrophosphorylase family protein